MNETDGVALKPGDRVRATGGSFAGSEGVIESIEEHEGTATVMMVLFGMETPVGVDLVDLEKI